MFLLRWLAFVLIVASSAVSSAKNGKPTSRSDESEDTPTMTFEPAIVQALKQPHSLDDLLQREEWKEELESLDMITSSFKDTTDLADERLNAEELVRQENPICATLPELLDEEQNLLIYPSTQCNPTDCLTPCKEEFIKDIETRFSSKLTERGDGQEPFCDELPDNTDGDEELVQSISNSKQLEIIGISKCEANGHALAEALRSQYKLVDTLQHAAFYWLRQNEPIHAIYCLKNLRRQTSADAQQMRDAQFLIAQLLFHAKRNKASILLLNRIATSEEPSNSNAIVFRVLASRLLHTDNCTAAIPVFETALKLDQRLNDDQAFKTELEFCRCRVKVIGFLSQEQNKLQRQLDQLNAYNDAMERELELHSLISGKTVAKQKFSDSWLAFSNIKFGPLPGLKCADASWNVRKHKKLQCKVTNLLDYFGTAAKKMENYRSSLEDLSEHDKHLKRYDKDRQSRELETAAEMDKKNDLFGLFKDYDKSNRMQTAQKLCNSKLQISPITTSNFLFLSPVNRGYPVEDLLNKYLNLAPNQIHPLPWDLPYCRPVDLQILNQTLTGQTISKLKSIQLLMESPELYTAEAQLLPRVAELMGLTSSSDLLLGDFGQRVRTLMQFAIGPEWLHHELAAFFFRCLGLFRESFDCLAQNLMQTKRPANEVELDITLSQFYGLIKEVNGSEGDQLILLLLMYEHNKDSAYKEAAISYQIGQRLQTIDAPNYLWRSFEIDPGNQKTVYALREHYCNRKFKFGESIRNKYAPICCWKTEHDVYCFKDPAEKGACFKVETLMAGDKVEHHFRSFRCFGSYVARSFAPPPVAHFLVGFILPVVDHRNQVVNAKIDDFLRNERQFKGKKDKMNAKKVLALDYGGYSQRRLAQFLPKLDDAALPLEAKAYINSGLGTSTDREIIVNGEFLSTVTDNSAKKKAKKEVNYLGAVDESNSQSYHLYKMWNGDTIQVESSDDDESKQKSDEQAKIAWRLMEGNSNVNFAHWEDIIHIDAPRPVNLPKPDPKLVSKGMEAFEIPPPAEITKFCEQHRLSNNLLEPVSTYLTLSAKGVNIGNLIDRKTKITTKSHKLEEPFCFPQVIDYKRLFHGLPGSQFSDQIKMYKPEKALRDALLSMGAAQDTVQIVGHRLSVAMKKLGRVENVKKGESLFWALATSASLYWRVSGKAHAAINCLIQSIDHAPRHLEDVAALSLANIYHQTGFLHSSLIAGHYALQASNGSIVSVHFTLANIYASMGEHKLAEQFYFSTLALQSNFKAAQDRIIALKYIGVEFRKAFAELCLNQQNQELVVFGAGNMAGCLIKAFVDKGCFTRDQIVLVTKTSESAKKWQADGFERSYSMDAYLKEAKLNKDVSRIAMIGVKPQYRNELYEQLKHPENKLNANIVVSILAGVKHEQLVIEFKCFHCGPIVRTTPNVAASVGSGLTLLFSPDNKVNQVVTKLLLASGDVEYVPESQFNAASAVAGSGPAFAFLIAEALSDGGVLSGLPRAASTRMAALMLRGAADLLLKSGEHPGQLKDQVCSPGGTTIQGIRQLEKHGVRSALIEAVLATKERADKLAS
ncbi:Tetratricopeptide repeat protein 17 [Aphelenchoides bicaudatus]|nr:Tetratricopeptide repeat protein 17 [Aphelenchoides bicaudatus]